MLKNKYSKTNEPDGQRLLLALAVQPQGREGGQGWGRRAFLLAGTDRAALDRHGEALHSSSGPPLHLPGRV